MSQFNSIVGNNITPLGKTSPVEVTKEVEEKAAEAKFHPSIIDGRPGVLHMGQYIEDGEGETKHRKVSETIGNAGKKMWEFAKKGGRFLKGGIDRVGSVVEKGALSLDKGLGQAGEWVGGKAKSVYEFGSQQYKNAGNFVNEKTKKIEGYQTKKVGLVEGVALLAGNKTEKVLKNVKTGIGDSYNGVMNYGRVVVRQGRDGPTRHAGAPQRAGTS